MCIDLSIRIGKSASNDNIVLYDYFIRNIACYIILFDIIFQDRLRYLSGSLVISKLTKYSNNILIIGYQVSVFSFTNFKVNKDYSRNDMSIW